MKASVIIPTFNKYERLKLTLHTLELQTYDKKCFEVIIINDGSTDETNQLISDNIFNFDLHYLNQTNKGRAAARNAGIKAAKNEILIFIDDDTVLDKDFIRAHIEKQQDNKSIIHGMIREVPYVKFFKDPSKGIFYDEFVQLGVNTKNLNQMCITTEELEFKFAEKIEAKSKITAHEKIVQAVFEYGAVKWNWITFSGGNMSLPKKWAEKSGCFDEKYYVNWGCEDMDLGYRLMERGYPFRYCKEAVNYHLDHFRKNFSQEHDKNMRLFYKKYKNSDFLLFQEFVEGKRKANDIIDMIVKSVH